jgi:hypothetical protein
MFFLRITRVQTQTLTTRTHTHPYEHTRKPYPYEHLQKIVPTHLEIDEVTIGVSLSTRTSPTTESTTPLNLGINPIKYEHPCQGRFHHTEPNQLS